MKTVLRKLIRLVLAFIPCLLMNGCSDSPTPNTLQEIDIRNGDLRAKFIMPAAYKVERGSEALMLFRCKYPSMEPRNPNSIPQGNDIDVYITLINRMGSTERMVAEALDRFDPRRPGLEYYAGQQGPYKLYRSIVGAGRETQTEVATYVFQAQDGSLVGVRDPGSWSANYQAERKIGNDLHIKYLISKPLGQDFIKIDEVVTAFIKNHFKTKPNRE